MCVFSWEVMMTKSMSAWMIEGGVQGWELSCSGCMVGESEVVRLGWNVWDCCLEI